MRSIHRETAQRGVALHHKVISSNEMVSFLDVDKNVVFTPFASLVLCHSIV